VDQLPPRLYPFNVGGFVQIGGVEGAAMFDTKFKLAAASLGPGS
jgi:hypothetical protein